MVGDIETGNDISEGGSLIKKKLWSIMSKTAERSNKLSATAFQESSPVSRLINIGEPLTINVTI